MNPLKALADLGQAAWLDFVARGFIAEGKLKRLVVDDGLTGVTSNPAIFEKAIGHGADYESAMKAALAKGDRSPGDLYEVLAIDDIRAAADVLRPVYDAQSGRDGYVSLEVSPYLALQTDATIAEAERLWKAVDRPNLMVKVPGTSAGLPAIRRLIGQGININVTLLFAQSVYRDVAEAYIAGLEDFAKSGGDVSRVASVASFFVSRIDAVVDKQIDERLKAKPDGELAALKGKVAIANAKLAYRDSTHLFAGKRWEALLAKGARPQRLLWASTGTKNPAYRDVLYVEELIGKDTVNTMPPATMDAFRDHGKARATIQEGLDEAEHVLDRLAKSGISLDKITTDLVEDGVRLFADAADQLLGAVARKRAELLGPRLNGMSAALPPELDGAVKTALEDWRSDGKIRRLWARDASLWTGHDEAKWLDWLDIVDAERHGVAELRDFAAGVLKDGFTHVLLLGMGGSSLGPEVFAETFGRQPGAPELLVLDSTDPAQIRTFEARIDPKKTLFIVASKSGSTLEPNILKQYFFALATDAVGAAKAGPHFVAITDPGSKMQQVAEADRFRKIFFGKPSIGGRYSVLSRFGLVPAAAMGLDIGRFLDATATMVRSCGADVPPAENPGVQLGAIMGGAALAGRDKVTIVASPGLHDLGAWLEQLIAESTGKQGKGIIPVDLEPLGPPAVYGKDRLFVYLRLDTGPDAAQDSGLAALQDAGQPVVRIAVRTIAELGQEFFRWEIATAVAGALIGINPFDQPDVEASKIKTRELTDRYEKEGKLPPETPFFEGDGIALFSDPRNVAALDAVSKTPSLAGYLAAHLSRVGPGDYVALLAYIERNKLHQDALRRIRTMLRDGKRVATCVGFGPRFLHSTGQAYKGGPNSGVFLQITCEDATDLPVPGQSYTFGIVEAAQARGDFEVLAERGRRALRIHLGTHVAAGLTQLETTIRQILA
ncbi:MAG: transaldolase phosphoglucose isomerase [Rhodospirillales bacterium]|nr:transaldolase phosphoglucose isomerase [Rhodospirillales bacterium]